MGQTVSSKENVIWKRRRRFKRHREEAKWDANLPGGSDIPINNRTFQSYSKELVQNCKSFPKLRFPEIHVDKKPVQSHPETENRKETFVQRLSREIKQETEAVEALDKLLKEECETLTKLEKKWLKPSDTKYENNMKCDFPMWFNRLLKDNRGIITLGPLFSPDPVRDPSCHADKLASRSLRLILRRQKRKHGVVFKVTEQYATRKRKSWKTSMKFTVVIYNSDNRRVWLTGDGEKQGQNVFFDLMILNKKYLSVNRKLQGVYVRQVVGADMLTWVVKSEEDKHSYTLSYFPPFRK